MPEFPKTSGWPERLWRNANNADIARGIVPGASSFSAFGEKVVSGAGSSPVWQTGMPNFLTVPDSIQLTAVSTSALDVGELVIKYLDGDLLARNEVLALDGLNPVTTAATDIRAINNIYSKYGPVKGTITFTSGGVTYAIMSIGDIQFHTSLVRVPADKRLMIDTMYAGAASGSSDSRVVVSLVTSFINGDSFAEDGWFHPLAAIAIQDSSQTMSGFGPFPVPPGEWVGFRAKWDKAVDITAGFFGWLEDV